MTTPTITYVIPGARTLDQQNEATLDGHADENAQDNCVAASIAEGLSMLTGVAYVGDEVKDDVYGQGYVGTQAAARYVSYCGDAARGVKLYAVNASQAGLIATIHSEIAAGHPVVVTMPSQWSVAPSDPVHPAGSTHVGLAVGVGPSTIRVMNPWHGFFQDQTDAWWQARLCYGQVWVMERITANVGGDFPVLEIAQTGGLFTANADGSWQASNGQRLYGAILTFYRNNAGARLFGLPLTDEIVVTAGYAGTLRLFERGAIAYDPEHRFDRVPGETDTQCYAMHVDHGPAFDHYAQAVKDALAAAQAQAAAQAAAAQKAASAAQASATALQQQRDALSSQLAQTEQQTTLDEQVIAQLKAQIDQLTTQLAAAQQAAQQASTNAAAPKTPADAAALLVTLIYAEADATLKAASGAPKPAVGS